MIKVTLPNGVSIEGTPEQIKDVMNSLGYKGIGDGIYYYSDSKGPILITEMNSIHLRNAILKFYKDWVDELHKIENPCEVVNKIVCGIDDNTWISMVKELSGREK